MFSSNLYEFLSRWPQAKEQKFAQNPATALLTGALKTDVIELISSTHPEMKVRASAGAGNWADIPWLAIMHPDSTITVRDGLYPVFLFAADRAGVYLSLNQGTTGQVEHFGSAPSPQRAVFVAKKLREAHPELKAWGPEKLSLNSTTGTGKSYEAPNVCAKYYSLEAIPSEAALRADLLALLGLYENVLPTWRSALQEWHLQMNPSVVTSEQPDTAVTSTSKPFILLAGLSGTGKTRFVRQQAKGTGSLNETYCLVSVRPDWHEPADLLGYPSRLGATGPEFVITDSLSFLVKAWVASVEVSLGQITQKSANNVLPYWLCLDEMNLAPVEQYFADYLSVMETRSWTGGEYQCDPILKPQTFTQLGMDGQTKLRADLGISGTELDSHWAYILKNGVQLPFNLIVAGTVNMDETTHGFSRKVIDRALTLDFGDFFPNRFDDYFESTTKTQLLTFPRHSAATKEDLAAVTADSDGSRSIEFLSQINSVLKDTSFELAFRALNELLVSVVCHAPETDEDLQAVWDDFLMTKILPRIEGDEDKLSKFGAESAIELLPALQACLEEQLDKTWNDERKDLYQTKQDDSDHYVPCRSQHKLAWMQQRLEVNGFTSFWP
jgi:hypothetical protein